MPALFSKGQVCAEFNRVASKNLEGDFFEALDQLIPRSLQLFKDRKGAVGQKLTELIQDINFVVRNFICLHILSRVISVSCKIILVFVISMEMLRAATDIMVAPLFSVA